MRIADQKNIIRRDMLARRSRMVSHDVKIKSAMIEKRLFATSEFFEKKSILFYGSFKKEVATFSMMNWCRHEKKRIFLPVLHSISSEMVISELFDTKSEITLGKWGIPVPKKEFMRPVSLNEIDTVIVPGVAFDKTGGRLGFGSGCYDRLLSKLSKRVLTFGICYDFQLRTKTLPTDENDMKVKIIITEKQVIHNYGI